MTQAKFSVSLTIPTAAIVLISADYKLPDKQNADGPLRVKEEELIRNSDPTGRQSNPYRNAHNVYYVKYVYFLYFSPYF